MNPVFRVILSLSITGSLLALVLFACRPLLKNRISKAFSYYIWLLVLLRLVVPIAAPSVNIMDTLFRTQQQETPAAEQADVPSEDETASTAVHADVSSNTQAAAAEPQQSKAAESHLPLNLWEFVRDHFTGIWLAGSAASLTWFTAAYFCYSRRVRRSCTTPHQDDLAVFRQLSRNQRVRLACSKDISTPLLMGAIRPVIILPQLDYVRSDMEEELRNILRHELTHYERKDILYKWLTVFITSLHWFNPLMLLIRREIGSACEFSCDEAVIAKMSAGEKQRYGNTLLLFSAGKKAPSGIPATTLCESKKELRERLVGIMKYHKKSVGSVVLMLVLALTLSACSVALGTAKTAEDLSTTGESSDTEQTTAAEESTDSTDDSEPLVPMFSFDGKIYYKSYEITEEEFYSQVEPDSSLGTVSSYVGNATLPESSLETNSRKLVGKSILGYYTIATTFDSLIVEDGGKLIVYQFLGNCRDESSSATASMFYYNGHLYEKASYEIDYSPQTGNQEPLATISTFVGSDGIPDDELETNDEALVGKNIVGLYSINMTGDTVVVDCGGEYKAYDSKYIDDSLAESLYISDKTEFGTEAEFLQEIKNTMLSSYQEISKEEWAADYGGSLAAPEYLPERFRYYDGIFVKPNPGIPTQVMIVQLWYDPDALDILTIMQESGAESGNSVEFTFSDKDEVGQAISKTCPWASGYCSYGLTQDDEWIYGDMLVSSSDRQEECKQILTSIHA